MNLALYKLYWKTDGHHYSVCVCVMGVCVCVCVFLL